MSCADCVYFRAGVLQDYCAFWQQFCISRCSCSNWVHRSSIDIQVNLNVNKEDAI